MRINGRRVGATIGLVLALVLAGCGGDGDDEAGGEASETTDASGSASGTEETEDGAESAEEPSEAEESTDEAASDEPIRVGLLTSLTGPFTPWGIQVRAGMQMAISELNDAGGVDGRMLELVEVDDQNNPEEGTSGLERMVEQDGIVAAGGVISSDVGLATSQTAEELEVPLFLVKAGAAGILTQESRHTFRTCLPAAPMVGGPVAQYIESQGLTRAGAIIADYAWGQSVRGALEESIGGLEGAELQVEVAPVTEDDFTTYLRSLEGFEPEVIVATGHPPGGPPITVQSSDLGLDVPVTGSYNPLATIFEGVGDAAFDRYADFGCVDYEDPEYQELATRFAETSEFGFMEDDAVAGYNIVQMVAEAVAEVGDDPAAVAEYLHGTSFDLPGHAFPLEWTEWGELAQATPPLVIIREQSPPEGINEGASWYPETLLVPEPLEPYVPE